jgi:hypothetical protein
VPETTTARPRLLWVLTALLGLATFAFGIWFTRNVPVTSCTGPLPQGVTALGAFQMARTTGDIEAVFGPAGDPCRATMVAAMDRANTVDLFGFIPTYGAFLACGLLALARLGARIARVGLVALVVGLAFDVLETATQLRLTHELPGSDAALTALAVGSVGKFAALALAALCAGLAMLARGGMAGRIAGILCATGAALGAFGLVDPSARPLLALGNALSWVVLLVYAIVAAIARPRAEPSPG